MSSTGKQSNVHQIKRNKPGKQNVAYSEGSKPQASDILSKPRTELRITDLLEQNLKIALDEKKTAKKEAPIKAADFCLRKEHFMGIAVEWPFPTMLKPQRQMAFSIIRALNNKKHVVLESPTGTGKSAAILCSVLAWQLHNKSKPDGGVGNIKVIYCSRTHSQVAQMVSSLRKTSYRPSMTVLGSRDRMCIHQHLPQNANLKVECRERVKATEQQRKSMLKSEKEIYIDDSPPTLFKSDELESTGKNDKGYDVQPTCRHYRQLGSSRTATNVITKLRANASPNHHHGTHDIEDLVRFGKNPHTCSNMDSSNKVEDHSVCPYYVTRALERHAELVFCPYNYILDPHIRTSLKIDLENTIVVLDEAHNVEDTLRGSGSGQWGEVDLSNMVAALRVYASAANDYEKGNREEVPLNQVAHYLLVFVETLLLDLMDRKESFEQNGRAQNALEEWKRFHTPDTTEIEMRYDGPDGTSKTAVGCKPYFDRVFAGGLPDLSKTRQFSARMVDHVQGQGDFRAAHNKTFEEMSELVSKVTHAIEKSQHYYVQSTARPNGSFEFCSGQELVDARKKKPKALAKNPPKEQTACFFCKNATTGHNLVWHNGRVHHGLYNTGAQPSWEAVLNLELLSPAPFMSDLVDTCHSVILASGSLAPLPSLCAELGLYPAQAPAAPVIQANQDLNKRSPCNTPQKPVPSGRLQDKPPPLEADHVIDLEKQLFAVAIGHMTNGQPLTVSYSHYKHDSFLQKLGCSIATVVESVPHGGVLVFLPSYSLLKRCARQWKSSNDRPRNEPSVWYRLENSKGKVIVEPTSGGSFEDARDDYAETIRNTGNCILFAVFRGKMSEGISFNDDNARAVICVGIPYPSSFSRSIKAKRFYNDEQRKLENRTDLLSGGSWYSQQAFRAVAQALGRCIRHAGDYGAIFLLDSRLCDLSPCDDDGVCMNHSRLPKWMRAHVKTLTPNHLHEPDSKLVGSGWAGLKSSLRTFFQVAPAHASAVLQEQREQLAAAKRRASEATTESKRPETSPLPMKRMCNGDDFDTPMRIPSQGLTTTLERSPGNKERPRTVLELLSKESQEMGSLTPPTKVPRAEDGSTSTSSQPVPMVVDLMTP